MSLPFRRPGASVLLRRSAWGLLAAAVGLVATVGRGHDPAPASDQAAIRAAAAAYADAFNRGDFAALADQWTQRAELTEGGNRLTGRDAIIASLRAWRARHPQATLTIAVGDVESVARPVVRVSGEMKFLVKPGAAPVRSRFTSLRVLEDGVWRLADSVVEPEHAAALDDLDWMIGTWQADLGGKATIEITYDKVLDGHCILGRTRISPQIPAGGPAAKSLDVIEVIHADRDAGVVRTWVFDSTGARAEGTLESDGTAWHKSMTGMPAEGRGGHVAHWAQVIAPTGEGRCTTHAIERSIDGVALPDAEPVHFRKVR